jgi:hypothetical protein
MGIEFRLSTNTVTEKPMVEAWKGGKFIASIYGHDDGLRVVSKHLDGVDHEPCYPPALVIHFSNGK